MSNNTLNVNEIFWSFQGEGLRAGVPSIFIRLAGCSLRCPYCDTPGSWENGTEFTLEKILETVDSYHSQYPGSQVVITGGEPLEQDIIELTKQLKNRDLFISLETNGLHDQDILIDWCTVSPKDINQYSIHEKLAIKIDEVKLIVTSNLTPGIVKQIRLTLNHMSKKPVPIFLQPNDQEPDFSRYQAAFFLFCQCQELGISGVRAGFQLHKIYQVD